MDFPATVTDQSRKRINNMEHPTPWKEDEYVFLEDDCTTGRIAILDAHGKIIIKKIETVLGRRIIRSVNAEEAHRKCQKLLSEAVEYLRADAQEAFLNKGFDLRDELNVMANKCEYASKASEKALGMEGRGE